MCRPVPAASVRNARHVLHHTSLSLYLSLAFMSCLIRKKEFFLYYIKYIGTYLKY
jgi:hypothetical protein